MSDIMIQFWKLSIGFIVLQRYFLDIKRSASSVEFDSFTRLSVCTSFRLLDPFNGDSIITFQDLEYSVCSCNLPC